MSMLELRGVSKSYGQGSAEVHALHQVSLTADEGAMVAVMGPSGSGKSTLLTIAGTLEEPTSGEVLIGGQPVRSLSRNAKARLRRRVIGYVFQLPSDQPAGDPGRHADCRDSPGLAAGRARPGRHRPPAARVTPDAILASPAAARPTRDLPQ